MAGVRTRYAPSPTGYMHLGNLRTGLYAYLTAKQQNGQFILRIEDTDQEREREGAVRAIYDTLARVGLQHDEGPDVGGPYGPYIQSERLGVYSRYADELIGLSGAYRCFCAPEETEAQREEARRRHQPFKDARCRALSQDEIDDRLAKGQPFVVRQRTPLTGTTSYDDVVFGRISIDNAELDDSVLLKSDGFPTYNFANVIDDHLMEITHVMRGAEYLSSTPKYILIYQAFGWDIPVHVHLPVINKSATEKLSKRHGDASFEDYYNKGYLPAAILNYIALLGWAPGTDEEFFTLAELVERFSFSGLSKSPSIFDPNKLRWMNGEYVRKLSLQEFHRLATPWYSDDVRASGVDLLRLSRLLHQRTAVLSEIPESIDFVAALPDYDTSLFTHKKMKTDSVIALQSLRAARGALEALTPFSQDDVHAALESLAASLGVKNGQVMYPVRVALSGKEFTPGGASEISELIGRDEALRRIDVGIAKLTQ
ncbi:MAG: glutamate--tRNA ligase [Thermaerobacter sp.]|nr:glutamate--tRNA ligase [Thermaerobacter sp.]